MYLKSRSLLICFLLIMTMTFLAEAQDKILMKIDDIEGDVVLADFRGWIELKGLNLAAGIHGLQRAEPMPEEGEGPPRPQLLRYEHNGGPSVNQDYVIQNRELRPPRDSGIHSFSIHKGFDKASGKLLEAVLVAKNFDQVEIHIVRIADDRILPLVIYKFLNMRFTSIDSSMFLFEKLDSNQMIEVEFEELNARYYTVNLSGGSSVVSEFTWRLE